MEVAIPGSNNGGSPFQREVREWQRIDPNTGALLTGRLEADRWINGSLNSYGKVVDSQNVSQPNGTQHSQRKQLEVLQARTSSGSMQVIRAHTVQTTSSRWTSSSSASSSNSSSPLMTSLSGGANHNIGSYLNSNHPQRFHANLSLTNESADNGPAADEDHLTSNFHLNHHSKQQQQQQQQPQQHHLFNTTPSLKLSNLMKSTPSVINGTSGSPNKANLHKPHDISATTSQRQQRHHQLFTTSSREQQQKSDSTTAVTSALLQQTSSSSSLSSTSTTAAIPSYSRKPTTTSSGLFRYDSSRYDLPTTETYVGGIGSGSGKIIDICSRDIDDVGDDDDDNSDDRVNPSAARRPQPTTTWQSTLQRGRSISTDDLTTNGNTTKHTDGNGGGDGGDDDDDEPAEWRRVSKIRRSFQFPSTTAPESSKAITSAVSRTRPLDLPERSVSVSKIRAELENGRRLSTAMRNNHVDLIALDNILNGGSASGSGTASPLTTKKKTASFLTAESLKEIRGKLKKLSDESLYKDDFVTKKEDNREENMPEKDTSNPGSVFQYTPRSNGNVGHTTNSLGSRSVKYKDTSSAEWHIRRKSYGFEKMSPPDDKSMFRFENSTDSGLGRSSDLGNWSPTTDSTNSAARATVITFGDQAKVVNSETKVRPMVQRRLRTRTQPLSEAESAEMKRHSIAVDESHYVRDNLRKTSAVHLNGFYSKDPSPQNSGFSDDNSRRQKRVEFCKTEVHFAAESGRVNIVETDGKPPPSNNFRRRRRSSSSSSTSSTSVTSTSSSSSLDTNKTGLPVIHFGDERKAIFDETFDGDDDLADDKSSMSNVTVSIPINLERNVDAENRDGDEHQDEISIRGILKNKPIKPKPYHLGENIENTDALWGIQLKPITRRSLSGERGQSEEDFKEATVSKSVAERVRIVEERKDGSGYSTKINLSLSNSPYEWTDTEVPQSNIMNIELHSPMATAIKKPESIRMQPPVAKPRTIHAVKQSTIHKQVDAQQNYQSQTKSVTSASAKEASDNLKIVKEARGARKLREHELSYFGVKPVSAHTTDGRTTVTTSKPKLTTNPKRSLPSRKLTTTTPSTKEEETLNKWSLPSDKPDLLRHSPILVEPQIVTKTAVVAPSIAAQSNRGKSPIDSSDDQTDGIYENLKMPSGPYCRQKDLARDEMILSEMTRSANQTLKAVSEEAARKDLRRRSISRQPSKPLETIDEKFTKPISKATTRSKLNAHRILRECTSRASSASSGDSLPGTPTRQRSRSRSRDSVDYVNIKPKSSSRTVKQHRSSSRESQKSATSSIEDTAHKVEVIRKSKRSSTKDEPVLVRHQHNQQQRSFRSSTESHDRHKVTPRSSTRDRVESHDQHPNRSHRSSQATTKSDTEHKRSSHSSTVDSKSSTKAIRSRPENEKSSKSSTERVSRSKAHSSHSQSDHHHQSKPHRSTGSKTATMSSSGMNSDILIHSKNGNHPTTGHSSSSSSKTVAKRCSKDRK